MTHEENSLQTKKAFCDSLKKIMKHKAFSRITISELVRDCNVNRKTFYYHFEDIYGLLKWMLEQEAIEVVKQFDLLADYKDALEFVIEYVQKNAFFLNCIYDSVGRNELKRFFCHDFIGLAEQFIRKIEQQYDYQISDEFRQFLCTLYTEGISGMLINLFQHPDTYDKDSLICYFTIVIQNSIPAVILSQKNSLSKFHSSK